MIQSEHIFNLGKKICVTEVIFKKYYEIEKKSSIFDAFKTN